MRFAFESPQESSLPRLFSYHRALLEARAHGRSIVTSGGLAEMLGDTIASTQIRKDLAALGTFGRRGSGYPVDALLRAISLVLGLDRDWRIAIVGFGYLGHALATFLAAREKRFTIGAIFDTAPDLVGTLWNGIPVRDVCEMPVEIARAGCTIGVIAVPAAAAQSTVDTLIACRVGAVLNFAPTTLRAPGAIVRNVDLAAELSSLTHHLSLALDGAEDVG